ncbi:kinase-like domain, phloem protein 2-like protein [Tanacetum coccineum]
MSSPNYHHLAHLKIPLNDILSATNNFDEENLIEEDPDFGNAYTGELLWSGELIEIDAQRLNKERDDEIEQQFWKEISMLSSLKHKNLVSLVGFCDENDEKIIIIKCEINGSLVNYLTYSKRLTWVRRLEISVGLAHALSYIHYDEQLIYTVTRNIDIGKQEKKLNEIIDWDLWNQMDSQSFNIFADIAYDCLNEERSESPNIDEIVTRLEKALELQREHHNAVIRFSSSIFLSNN